jgi:hypothetical protein
VSFSVLSLIQQQVRELDRVRAEAESWRNLVNVWRTRSDEFERTSIILTRELDYLRKFLEHRSADPVLAHAAIHVPRSVGDALGVGEHRRER